MFNYHCTVLKQNSVFHNVAWKQRLVSLLAKEEYQPEGGGAYTNVAGESFVIEETDTAFKLSSTCPPTDKIVLAVKSLYDIESSGMEVDVGLVLREVGVVAAVAAGFISVVCGATFTKGLKERFSNERLMLDKYLDMLEDSNSYFLDGHVSHMHDTIRRGAERMIEAGVDSNTAIQKSFQAMLRCDGYDSIVKSRVIPSIDIEELLKNVPQGPEGVEVLFENLKTQMLKESFEGAKESLVMASNMDVAQRVQDYASKRVMHIAETEFEVGAVVGGAVVGGSAIISVLKNLKHKRPCVGTSNGTRVALRIPTRCSAKELELLMKNINLLDLGGVAAVTDPETCTIRVVPKLDKLSQYYFSLDVTDGVMEIQSWLQKGNGDTRKEKDFPSGLVPSKQVGNKIFNAMLSKFLVEPEFTEANRGVVISINPDIEEIPQCISTNA